MGSGSAGCPLAARLAKAGASVLLVEAGGEAQRSMEVQMPKKRLGNQRRLNGVGTGRKPVGVMCGFCVFGSWLYGCSFSNGYFILFFLYILYIGFSVWVLVGLCFFAFFCRGAGVCVLNYVVWCYSSLGRRAVGMVVKDVDDVFKCVKQ